MKRKIISCFFCLLVFLPAIAQEKPSREAEAFFKKAMSEINPRHVAWIQSTANTIHEKKMTGADAKKMASQYGALSHMNNSDIEALTLLVIMQASKDAQEDLKSILSSLQSINGQKKQIRNLQLDLEKHKNEVSRPGLDSIKFVLKNQPLVQKSHTGKVMHPVKIAPTNTTGKNQLTTVSHAVTKQEIDKTEKDIKDKLDSLSEMSEMDQIRLQQVMDKKNQMMSMISNLMKKMSESESSIIQNLK